MARFLYRLLVIALLTSACSTGSREESEGAKKEQATEETVNDYPDLTLTLLGGDNISTRSLEGNNIFIFFQPDCRHCQIEAINIEQRLEQFKDYDLYFVSSSSAESIQAFAESFDLDDRKNVKFASASSESVLSHYGPIQTPSVYIYSNGILKKSFNGQTDIENIIKAL